jgi:hypothetical protein
MWTLLFVLNGMTPAYLGDYKDFPTCRAAVREIISLRLNPPNQKLKELESVIDLQLKETKEFLCIKKN